MLVRATGDIHLLSTWDEGIPDDIPHEHLYGITFNPMNMVEVLQGVAGAATANRVGTDSMTPMFAQLLPMAFPAAELVDGEATMRRARRTKTVEELTALRRSVALVQRCLAASEAELRVGITERRLTGRFMEEMALAGVTTPSSQDVAWITSPDHPWRRGDRDTPIRDGDLVVLSGGVVRDGYTGELARTHVVGSGHDGLLDRLATLRAALLSACVPGAAASALLGVYADHGIAPPPVPIARGLGLGFDLPIVTADLPEVAAAEVLDEGVVFALTSYVWQPGSGAAITVDPVHIAAHGAELLTTGGADDTDQPTRSDHQ